MELPEGLRAWPEVFLASVLIRKSICKASLFLRKAMGITTLLDLEPILIDIESKN